MGGRKAIIFRIDYFPTLENLPFLIWSVNYKIQDTRGATSSRAPS